MFTWWNGDLVKWCGENNTKLKWCNGETIILTFDSRWFLGPLQRWGPIPLLHFIGCCIKRWGEKISEWCRSDCLNGPWAAATPFDSISPCFHPIDFYFSLYFSFVPPPQTLGGFVFLHTFLYLDIDWCNCTGASCQALLYYRTKHIFRMEAVVTT